MNEKVKNVLDDILERFKSPRSLPKAIAYATFPPPDIPCCKWSFLNRIIISLAETNDARGIRQWNRTKRHVKAGSKAIYILGPVMRPKSKVSEEVNEEMEILVGFRAIPVFRAEDTEGEPLEYAPHELPEFPLIEKAKQWGITVKSTFYNNRYLGCYHINSDEITLASPDELVFFHELAHAAHKRVLGDLIDGQDWKQEIVAELSAQALCYLVGKEPERTLGNSYNYIKRYAEQNEMSAINACIKVFGDVERVLTLICTCKDRALEC